MISVNGILGEIKNIVSGVPRGSVSILFFFAFCMQIISVILKLTDESSYIYTDDICLTFFWHDMGTSADLEHIYKTEHM